jgi:hypothetical protein
MASLYRFYVGLGASDQAGLREHNLFLAKRVASQLFGGYTLTVGEGGWRGPDGLKEEPSAVFEVIGKQPRRTEATAFRDFLLAQFQQKAVLVVRLAVVVLDD